MLEHARALPIALPLLLAACAGDDAPALTDAPPPAATDSRPTVAELADRLVEAMGGRVALEGLDTLVRRGDGTRTRMGQIAATGGEDPLGTLTNVTETIDFEDSRAAYDYDVSSGGFMQHRTEVYTTFRGERVGWATGPNRPNVVTSPNGLFSWATQNSPEMLLRRNVVTVALAADATAPGAPATERPFAGGTSLHGTAELPSGESVELYFDPATGLLDGYVTLDTETMLGDVEAQYILDDYRPVGDLVLPHSVTIRKQGRPYSSIEYASMTINDDAALAIFEVPGDVLDQAERVVAAGGAWVPLQWNEVAAGVYHAVGYSHHSLVVEFPSFVAIVEGPYTEAQSLQLVATIEAEIGKPIRYVAPTHPHYDHTGGIRGLVAFGADVLVAAGHEQELRGIVEAPHTNPPDALAEALAAGSEVGTVEVFSGMTVIEDGDQRLELYEVATIPHVNPMVLAYVPAAGVLFQSDLFFGAPSPDAEALYAAVIERELDVERIVGGHGGVLPFSSLEASARGD